jgi:hypothetical protein
VKEQIYKQKAIEALAEKENHKKKKRNPLPMNG